MHAPEPERGASVRTGPSIGSCGGRGIDPGQGGYFLLGTLRGLLLSATPAALRWRRTLFWKRLRRARDISVFLLWVVYRVGLDERGFAGRGAGDGRHPPYVDRGHDDSLRCQLPLQ